MSQSPHAPSAKWTPAPWHVSGEYIVQTQHITRDVWTIPHEGGDLERVCACVNACSPIQGDPAEALAKAREALRYARDLLDLSPENIVDAALAALGSPL